MSKITVQGGQLFLGIHFQRKMLSLYCAGLLKRADALDIFILKIIVSFLGKFPKYILLRNITFDLSI